MNIEYLLNIVELKDGRSLIGIIDYDTKKQLYFFDFTNEENLDYLLLSMLWKGNKPNMRFSVYCVVYFPNLILPKANLIPLTNVRSINGKIPEYERPKQRKRLIKVSL